MDWADRADERRVSHAWNEAVAAGVTWVGRTWFSKKDHFSLASEV